MNADELSALMDQWDGEIPTEEELLMEYFCTFDKRGKDHGML
jgi:hypothetical protein